MRQAYIYTITLAHDIEKVYVGSSVNVESRKKDHNRLLTNGKHHSKKLQNSFKKYKHKEVELIVIEECTQDNRDEREQYWINHYNSMECGYNMVSVDTGSASTHETRMLRRVNKIEKYKELEDKLLALFLKYEGVIANTLCSSKGYFYGDYCRFSIMHKLGKRSDKEIVETTLQNLNSFEKMIEHWLSMTCTYVEFQFQEDIPRFKREKKCYVYSEGSYDNIYFAPYRYWEKDLQKYHYGYNKVNDVLLRCLEGHDKKSLFGPLMAKMYKNGFEMTSV